MGCVQTHKLPPQTNSSSYSTHNYPDVLGTPPLLHGIRIDLESAMGLGRKKRTAREKGGEVRHREVEASPSVIEGEVGGEGKRRDAAVRRREVERKLVKRKRSW